jgi:hypothetical protein
MRDKLLPPLHSILSPLSPDHTLPFSRTLSALVMDFEISIDMHNVDQYDSTSSPFLPAWRAVVSRAVPPEL